jgi:hypothetical protein
MVRKVEVDREVTLDRAVREVVDDASRPMDGMVISPGIAKPAGIAEPRRVFNPTNPGQPPRIVLERTFESGREFFRLRHPIGYWDAEVGAVIVPDNLAAFRTDLTSSSRTSGEAAGPVASGVGLRPAARMRCERPTSSAPPAASPPSRDVSTRAGR